MIHGDWEKAAERATGLVVVTVRGMSVGSDSVRIGFDDGRSNGYYSESVAVAFEEGAR